MKEDLVQCFPIWTMDATKTSSVPRFHVKFIAGLFSLNIGFKAGVCIGL